ncbi:MAG TPA: hypothetical protein VH024_14635, partial [Candidatus Angelobacter sp.]|nr:hypothetical protein [Candidatus Angelobacter sp.]
SYSDADESASSLTEFGMTFIKLLTAPLAAILTRGNFSIVTRKGASGQMLFFVWIFPDQRHQC